MKNFNFILFTAIFLACLGFDFVLAADCRNWDVVANIGGVIKYDPAVMSAGDRLIVAAIGTDNALWVNEFDVGKSPDEWYSLNGVLVSGISMAQETDGKITVSTFGSDNVVWSRSYLSSRNWSEWKRIGSAQLFALGPNQAIVGNTLYRVFKKTDNSVQVDKCTDSQICIPGTISGCRVCRSDGLVWADDDSKCNNNKICSNGNCASLTDVFNTRFLNAPGWGCNSVGFWQIPNQSNLFLGRIMQDFAIQGDSCSGRSSALGIGIMDWSNDTLTFMRKILTPPVVLSDGFTIAHAYDPSVIYYNDEYWVAFECVGNGLKGASACIGPLDINGGIDITRAYVAVHGNTLVTGIGYSASVPKLFLYQGRVYLYWSAVHGDANSLWFDVTSRGIELEQEQGSLKRLWPKGVGTSIVADDSRSMEVLGLGSDNRSNTAADLFQVFAEGDYIYAIFARGGNGGDLWPRSRNYCVSPGGISSGCYRLSVSRAAVPLGYHIFNQDIVPDGVLPSNIQEYGHYWINNNGMPLISSHFFPPLNIPVQRDAQTIPAPGICYFFVQGGVKSYFTVCISNQVSGCKVCKADGSGWTDDNSKCAREQVCDAGICKSGSSEKLNTAVCSGDSQCVSGHCQNTICCDADQCGWGTPAPECVASGGLRSSSAHSKVICRSGAWKVQLGGTGCSSWQCDEGVCNNNVCGVIPCVAKTCTALGNYQCGSWSNECGNAINCGVCASGKSCNASGRCVVSGGGGGGETKKEEIMIVAKMARVQIIAKINEIVALISKLQAQLKVLSGGKTVYSCGQITKNLYYGMKNDTAVKCLQEVLKAQGYAVAANGNYDLATKIAVVKFQQKYAKEILAPYGLKYGSGNVGNATKNKLNQIINLK